MNPTDIEWTHVYGPKSGFTTNPVFGCTGPAEGPCPYCYARERVAPRVGYLCGQYPDPDLPAHRRRLAAGRLDPVQSLCAQFFPHAHLDRLEAVERRRKPAGIFVGSCTDLWDPHVDPAWRRLIWQTVDECPQHTFFMLTKRPENIIDAMDRAAADNGNLWRGVSVTGRDSLQRAYAMSRAMRQAPWFVSCEPLLGPVDPLALCLADWIIVGALSGPGATQAAPERCRVEDIVVQAVRHYTPVFLKNSLRPIVGDELVDAYQQWPEAMRA